MKGDNHFHCLGCRAAGITRDPWLRCPFCKRLMDFWYQEV